MTGDVPDAGTPGRRLLAALRFEPVDRREAAIRLGVSDVDLGRLVRRLTRAGLVVVSAEGVFRLTGGARRLLQSDDDRGPVVDWWPAMESPWERR